MAWCLAGCTQLFHKTGPDAGRKQAPPKGQTKGGVTQQGEAGRPAPLAAAKGLGEPTRQRNWEGVRLQAARRLVAANPDITYTSRPPDILKAIPVLTVDLHADGSIRRIEIMRRPRQALQSVEIAKQALRRAAPFGPVAHLPKPWRFNETFLFNDDLKFKPMTLDRRAG